VSLDGLVVASLTGNAIEANAAIDTQAVQAAIDRAFDAGGGTVWVPRDFYRSPVLRDQAGTRNYAAGACIVLRSGVVVEGPDITVRSPSGRNTVRCATFANEACKIYEPALAAGSPLITSDFGLRGISVDGGGRIYDITSGTGNTIEVDGDVTSRLVVGMVYRTIAANGTVGTGTVSSFSYDSLNEVTDIVLSGTAPSDGTINVTLNDPTEVAISLVNATITATTIQFAAALGDVSDKFAIGSTFGVKNSGGGNGNGNYVTTAVVHSGGRTTVTVASTAGLTALGDVYPGWPGLWYGDGVIIRNAKNFFIDRGLVEGFAKYGDWIIFADTFDVVRSYNQESDGCHIGGGCFNFSMDVEGRTLDNMAPFVSDEGGYRAAILTKGDIRGEIRRCEIAKGVTQQINPIRCVGTTGTRITCRVRRAIGTVTVGNWFEMLDDTSLGGLFGAVIDAQIDELRGKVSSGYALVRAQASGLERLYVQNVVPDPDMSVSAKCVSLAGISGYPVLPQIVVVRNCASSPASQTSFFELGNFSNPEVCVLENNEVDLAINGKFIGWQGGTAGRLVAQNNLIAATGTASAGLVFMQGAWNGSSNADIAVTTGISTTAIPVSGDHTWRFRDYNQVRLVGNSTTSTNGVYSLTGSTFSTGTTTLNLLAASSVGAMPTTPNNTTRGSVTNHVPMVLENNQIINRSTSQAAYFLQGSSGSFEIQSSGNNYRTNVTSSLLIFTQGALYLNIVGDGTDTFSGFISGGLCVPNASTVLRIDHPSWPFALGDSTAAARLVPRHGDRILNFSALAFTTPFSPGPGLCRFRLHSTSSGNPLEFEDGGTVGGWVRDAGVTASGATPNADTTLNVNHQDIVLTNAGHNATRTMTLPAALPGMRFRFQRTDAQTYQVDPNGTEIVEDVPLTTGAFKAAGVLLGLTTINAFVELQCFRAGEWRATVIGSPRASFT
jgi:hypothetical protein